MSKNNILCWSALAIVGAIFCIVATGSYLTSSDGILSDALHTLADSFPFVLFLMAAKAKSDERKAELKRLLWKANFWYLCIIATMMFGAAMYRLVYPKPVEVEMIWYAMFGLAANVLQFFFAQQLEYEEGTHEEAESLRTTLIHLAIDIFASVCVIVAALVVVYWNDSEADTIATIIVGVVTGVAAYFCRTGKRHSHSHEHHGHNHGH